MRTPSSPPGAVGNSVIGGTFYTADRYPSAYWGAYFFSDFGQNWVRVARFNGNDELVSVEPFATGTEGAVDWVAHPSSGDLYYVAILSGEVRRLRYTGPQPNRPPTAVASASPRAGAKPLAVDFSSAGPSDPDNVTGEWEYAAPQHPSGTFLASRTGGAAEAVYRFSATYEGGDDAGTYTFDISAAGAVSGTAYSVVNNAATAVSGTLGGNGTQLTATAGQTGITAAVDLASGTLSGGDTVGNTLVGGGCRLN